MARTSTNSGEFLDYFARHKDEPVYVILGSQGSGTNLLSNLTQAVFGFSVVRDRSLIVRSAARTVDQPARIRAELDHVYRSLFPNPLRKRLMKKRSFRQASHFVGIEDYLHTASISTAEEFANFFFCYHMYTNGGSFKAIKSDDIWEQLCALPKIIPQRRTILLVRDPRDNALSIVNKQHFGPRDIYVASRYVKHRLDAYRAETESHAETSLTIQYETLLGDPQTVSEQLADFLELRLPNDSETRIAALKIRPQNYRKWEKLSKSDLAACEGVLADDCRYFGYELSGLPPVEIRGLEKLRRTSRDIALRIPQKIRNRMRQWST